MSLLSACDLCHITDKAQAVVALNDCQHTVFGALLSTDYIHSFIIPLWKPAALNLQLLQRQIGNRLRFYLPRDSARTEPSVTL